MQGARAARAFAGGCLGIVALAPNSASAFVWEDLAPGVRYAAEVRPGPINVYVTEIDTCTPGVQFRATSPNDGEFPRVTSAFADLVGATVAINGDFFDHDFGMNVGAGAWWGAYGASDGLDSATSGNFAVGLDRIEMYPEEVLFAAPEPWMQEVVSGRWTLIRDGVPVYGIADGGYVCSPGLRHPRTVLGRSEDGRRVWLMVVDGRGLAGSIGITCDEAIDVLLELGAWQAMGLDGGGSSTMVVGGAVVNHPSDGHERSVLNHLGVLTGGPDAPHCGERPAAPIGSSAAGPVVAVGAPGGLHAVVPRRLFDTRHGTAGLGGVAVDADGRVLGGTSFDVDRATLGVPTDASAVLFALTATDPQQPGFVTVHPAGEARPEASNLNYAAGDTVPNAVAAAMSAGGIGVYTTATTHLIADLQGWFDPTGDGLQPLAPARILDTRTDGVRIPAGATAVLSGPLQGGATALSLNVTAVLPSVPGFVTVYPCDEAVPDTSNLNFQAGDVVGSAVTVADAGGICAFTTAETDLVVDVTGAWTPGDGLQLQPVVPVRLLDTRGGPGIWQGRARGDQVLDLDLRAVSGFPADGRAVAVNVTVTEPSRAGFVTLFPCAEAVPDVSTLNYAPGDTVGNLAIAALADDGRLCLVTSAPAHLVVDLAGVFVGAASTGGTAAADTYVDVPEREDEDVATTPSGCTTGGTFAGGAGLLVAMATMSLPTVVRRRRR